jgi:putative flavoprotein involved in K+ transport
LRCPGRTFSTAKILHSSAYSDGSAYKGKRCVVIGAASSGQDVADLWEAGAEVTIVRRSPTTAVRSETLMELAFELYSEQAVTKGIDVDTAERRQKCGETVRVAPLAECALQRSFICAQSASRRE